MEVPRFRSEIPGSLVPHLVALRQRLVAHRGRAVAAGVSRHKEVVIGESLRARAAGGSRTERGQQNRARAAEPGEGSRTDPGQQNRPRAAEPGEGRRTDPGQQNRPRAEEPTKSANEVGCTGAGGRRGNATTPGGGRAGGRAGKRRPTTSQQHRVTSRECTTVQKAWGLARKACPAGGIGTRCCRAAVPAQL